MKLIDADALMKYPIRINHYDKENGNEDFVLGIESVLEYAENLPTIESEPVKYGHWKICSDGYYPYCSNCQSEPQGMEMTDYCPNCGARVDGKDGENG